MIVPIQMLNCCINHRNSRSNQPLEMPEEDEFFDAVEDVSCSPSEQPRKHAAWNQPQGRKEKSKWKLIQTGETLHVPYTQVVMAV